MDSFVEIIVYPALFGLGALIVWLIKFYIPKVEERRDKELEVRLDQQKQEYEARLKQQQIEAQALLDGKRDEREYRQASGNLAVEVLERVMREQAVEHSKEIDELRQVIEANTEALKLQGIEEKFNAIRKLIQNILMSIAYLIDEVRSGDN